MFDCGKRMFKVVTPASAPESRSCGRDQRGQGRGRQLCHHQPRGQRKAASSLLRKQRWREALQPQHHPWRSPPQVVFATTTGSLARAWSCKGKGCHLQHLKGFLSIRETAGDEDKIQSALLIRISGTEQQQQWANRPCQLQRPGHNF